MEDNALTASLKGAAEGTKELMNGSVLGTIAINLVLASSLGPIMGMINSLQLIFHLPMMSTIAPGNVMTMFAIMIPVVMFDITESMDLWADVFPDSQAEMEYDDAVLDQMKNIGYDSYNPILNLGTLFFLLLVYIARVIFHVLVAIPLWKLGILPSKVYFKMKNQLFFGHFLIVFIEGYIEFLIAARLFYQAPPGSVDNTPLSNSVAYPVLFLAVILLPGLYIWILTKPKFELNRRKTFRRRWLTLYEDLKCQDKLSLSYNLFFVFRRMVYVQIAFMLSDVPCQQI